MQVGITSEVVLAISALPHIRAAVAATGMLSVSLPNAWNFGFDFYWAAVVATMLYVPGAPFLYVRDASGLGPLTLRASASVFAMRCPAPRDSAPQPPGASTHSACASLTELAVPRISARAESTNRPTCSNSASPSSQRSRPRSGL